LEQRASGLQGGWDKVAGNDGAAGLKETQVHKFKGNYRVKGDVTGTWSTGNTRDSRLNGCKRCSPGINRRKGSKEFKV
jgi:hypothetical protein